LRGHAGVGEAVVVVREDAPGDRRLVAYVVPAEGGEALPRWRDWLAARLPDYMIPTLFVELAALPLSPAGKLDRRALPVPERGSDLSSAPPATPAEELLAEIWSEVLGVDRVGSGDDFFALGGHSLLATQVVSRVRTVFGVELPVRAVFESPALAEQAIRIEHLRAGEPAVPELPLVCVPREGDLPLSFAQQRMWFLDRLTPGSPLYNIPSPLRVAGPLDPGLLAQVLSELSRRHESLRTTFDAVGGEPHQRIHSPSPLWIPVIDLGRLPDPFRESEAIRLAMEGAGEGFDLERGPLLRVRLVRLDTEDHVLLATLHHIVSDGWSTGVMIREVSALYEAFQQGLPSPLAELPVQYADFSHWQRRRLSGESLEAELGYWRGRLSGLPAVLGVRTDRPRPAGPRVPGTGQLARAAERFAGVSGAADGSSSAGGPAVPRHGAAGGSGSRAVVGAGVALPAGAGGARQGSAGGVPGAVGSGDEPGELRGGHADRGSHAGGAGGADRVFRQHAGAAG